MSEVKLSELPDGQAIDTASGSGTMDNIIIGGSSPKAGTFSTVNALSLTSLSVGFSIAGGTTSKTLTVPLNATVSGTNTGDQTITLTGDITGTGTGSFAATLATVNSNVGSFGSATASPTYTVNAKGLITAAANVTITPAVGSITGLGTGVATALGVNTGSAGSFVVNTPGGTAAFLGSAQSFTAGQRGAFATLTDASTIAVDLSLANNYNLTLGGTRVLGVPTNPVAGQTGLISVRQDITGSRALTYSWPYTFPGGVAPTLSTAALSFDQLYYCVNSYATSTVTVTIAAPAVMTWTAHGLKSGQRIQLTTTGALPTGLSASTTYWVTVIDANTFNLSTSLANAQSASFITTTGSQSGTHTAVNFSITISSNLGIA